MGAHRKASKGRTRKPYRSRSPRKPNWRIDDPLWEKYDPNVRTPVGAYCSYLWRRFSIIPAEGKAPYEFEGPLDAVASVKALSESFDRAGMPIWTVLPFRRLVPALCIYEECFADGTPIKDQDPALAAQDYRNAKHDFELLQSEKVSKQVKSLLNLDNVQLPDQLLLKSTFDTTWLKVFEAIPFLLKDHRDLYRESLRRLTHLTYRERMNVLRPPPPSLRKRSDPVWNAALVEGVQKLLKMRDMSEYRAYTLIHQAWSVLWPEGLYVGTMDYRHIKDLDRRYRARPTSR